MQPGTKWKYSGGGYTISQLIIEEVTGQPFQDYMREQVLKPLGMHNSDYQLTPTILAASSVAYDNWGKVTPNPRFTAQAAAGLHTTIEDFGKFAAAALAGQNKEMPGRGVLKPESVKEMTTTAAASNDKYGLGYGIEKLPKGLFTAGHGGSNRGWQAFFAVMPKTGDGIVVMSNSSNGFYAHQFVTCKWKTWVVGIEPNGGCEHAKPINLLLQVTILDKGIDAAVKQYNQLRKSNSKNYDFRERHLNNLGYGLLGEKKFKQAIKIFQLNVAAYPKSANTYDSLGEAYMLNGDRKSAIKNYQKALVLDPKNSNAINVIRKLEENINESK